MSIPNPVTLDNTERAVKWAQKMWALLLYFNDKPVRRMIESQCREQRLKAEPLLLDWNESALVYEFNRKPSSLRNTLLRMERAGIIHEYRDKVWRSGARRS